MITPVYRRGFRIKVIDINKSKRRITLDIYQKRFKFFWIFATRITQTVSIYGSDDIERAVDLALDLYCKDLFPEEVKSVDESNNYDWFVQGLMEVKDEICKG